MLPLAVRLVEAVAPRLGRAFRPGFRLLTTLPPFHRSARGSRECRLAILSQGERGRCCAGTRGKIASEDVFAEDVSAAVASGGGLGQIQHAARRTADGIDERRIGAVAAAFAAISASPAVLRGRHADRAAAGGRTGNGAERGAAAGTTEVAGGITALAACGAAGAARRRRGDDDAGRGIFVGGTRRGGGSGAVAASAVLAGRCAEAISAVAASSAGGRGGCRGVAVPVTTTVPTAVAVAVPLAPPVPPLP